MKVFFSHTGYNNLVPEIVVDKKVQTLSELIDEINQKDGLAGIKNTLTTEGKLASNVRVFKNVLVDEIKDTPVLMRRYYEKDNTEEITSLSASINDMENVLFSIFEPKLLLEMINKGMSFIEGDNSFDYIDEDGRTQTRSYKPMISEIDFETNLQKEKLYEFKNGECTFESLMIPRGESSAVKVNGDTFDKKNSKLLPEDLISAIADLWEIEKSNGRLRLFQEDALFFIMSRLIEKSEVDKKQLLLSMPTGGGKTEAFMIPLLSSIYQNKISKDEKGIQAIIIYPTNALANDQAARFVEMIYGVNERLSKAGVSKQKHISIGIMTGDTPNNDSRLESESLIKICPNCRTSHLKKMDGTLVCNNILEDGEPCGTVLDFCRLTKKDIIDNPPDILITNPDTINFALHSPRYGKIFKNKIKAIVFDEVHIYQGVFGCHIAHLFRRLEERMGHKPLYIGMSATIGNAKQLAALLFDEPISNIEYIQNENNKYMTDKVNKIRYHMLMKPYLRGERKRRTGQIDQQYVRTMSVAGCIGLFIGHVLADSHFRKSIIFTNYRTEADDLAGYLRERERLDGKLYFDKILEKLQNNRPLHKEEVEICEYMNKWYETVIRQMNQLNSSVEVGWNRGGLEKKERIRSIHSFSINNMISSDETPIDLMVATKSLEVGIDIGDVTTVINSSAPFTVNEYVQRVGRAGRKKDSLAITIVNPENAIDAYVMKHFQNYVHPNGVFEDAPIIVNNEIIIKRHVEARIVDYFMEELYRQYPGIDSYSPTVEDVMGIEIFYNGKKLQLKANMSNEEVSLYSKAIAHNTFARKIDNRKSGESYLEFIKRESEILGTKETNITFQDFEMWIKDVFVQISDKITKRKVKPAQFFTGIGNAAFPELMPSLRGSGATVSLYLTGDDSEDAIDVVSRQTAFYQMPMSSDEGITTTKSGISTFKIVDNRKEPDKEAESLIKQKLYYDENARKFFYKSFDEFPEDDDMLMFAANLNVHIVKNLNVSYFPSRFYCDNCKTGLIVKEDCFEKEDGVYCKGCGKKAQQLHKVYMCTNEDCGNLFDPPVPKVCTNPDCESTKKSFNIFKENNYSFRGKRTEILKHFKFRLTKDQEWVCEKCGNRINFTSWRNLMECAKPGVNRIIGNKDSKTIDGFCGSAINYPEKGYGWGKDATYEKYKCDFRDHKERKAVPVPRVRTIAYNYVGNNKRAGYDDILCEPVHTDIASIDFNMGYVIQMANEYMRRFSTGSGEKETYRLKAEKIFTQNTYWSNYYESHLAWISFGEHLDNFIKQKKYSCDCDCANCNLFDNLDLGSLMRPRQYVEDYNYDAKEMKPKKPDHRRKYCTYAAEGLCTQQTCAGCDNFSKEQFLRYIIVHTIKHGLLWALPKYAGVGVSEIKGEVYPNDNKELADLVLIDSNEGGSGAIILVQKHWDDIWKFAEDIIQNTTNNEANIILPHTCSRYNSDLCPFITKEFLQYFNTKE